MSGGICFACRNACTMPAVNRIFRHGHLYQGSISLGVSYSGVRQLYVSGLLHQRVKEKESTSGQIIESKEKPFSELTIGQKVQRAGKDATYTGIILGGLAVTGLMFYAIGRELFSGQSPSGVYSRAVKLCSKSERVRDAIGEPMKAFGEMNRRGRRRHVRSALYETDGIKRMRVQFYIEGPLNTGTVHVDMKQDDRGRYQFDYVAIELDNYPGGIVVVEDNRHVSSSSSTV